MLLNNLLGLYKWYFIHQRDSVSWVLSPNMIQYCVSINMDIDAKSMQIDSTSSPTLPHASSLGAAASFSFDFSAGHAVFMRGWTLHPCFDCHYASSYWNCFFGTAFISVLLSDPARTNLIRGGGEGAFKVLLSWWLSPVKTSPVSWSFINILQVVPA